MKILNNNLIDKTQVTLKDKRESQRDNYSLAIVFLPLMGVVIWLGIIIINLFVVEKSRINWEATILDKERTITQKYQQTLIVNGELVIKTNQLSGVIEKDIQPEEVFILVENLFPQDPEFNVTGFGRNNDGSFSVTVSAPNFIKFAKIARRFNLYERIKDVQVRDVGVNSDTKQLIGTVSFNFITTVV